MYECEGDSILNPGDDMMSGHSACTAISAESAKIAHSLTSSKFNRDCFDNPQTSGTILECLAESSLKDSKGISESTISDSHLISESTSKTHKQIKAHSLYFTHKRGYYA